jgi:succinyl-CoA synthetase beta subunit
MRDPPRFADDRFEAFCIDHGCALKRDRALFKRADPCLGPAHSRPPNESFSRAMNIHEYQAKELLAAHGIAVPAGYAALSVEEAVAAAKKLPGPLYVVKAQIHAGGRGKGKFKELGADAKGGVRLAKSIDEVEANAREMLGNTLVTIQTGEHGKEVNRLYITDGVDIASEFYLSLLVDRDSGRVAFVVSTEGGMDIEGVAHDTPEKITTFTIDPAEGFMPHHGRAVAFALKLTGDLNKQAQALAKKLYDAFLATDCSMLEINPLVVTEDGRLLVLDAKMSFDSNAMYRHPDIEALRDETEEDPAEVEASKSDLAYIKLDGNIGCMVNGAGLAMATMDIIKLNGAFPANFLDVGGGASKEKVTAAFKIILKDPAVKGILVNIFGGIMKCDIIAEGIVAAAKEVNLSVPLVVRLEGTNVEQGKAILASSGLAIVPADDLGDAAKKIVAEVKKAA